jgi:hypothetical protein
MQLRKWFGWFDEVSHNIMVMTHSPHVDVGTVGKSVSESDCRSSTSEASKSDRWWTSELDLLVEKVYAKPPSHVDNDTAEVTWPQCSC